MPSYEEIKELEEKVLWAPYPHQEEFISIPDTIKEGFFGGSVGPGKTDTLLNLLLVRGFHKIRGFKAIMLRRTLPEHEREVIPRSMEIFPHTGAKFAGGKSPRWYWPQYNSFFFFGHSKEEDHIRRYDGTQWNLVMFDELTSFTEFQYTYMLQRCRSGIKNFPVAVMRSASMPGNIGHHWVRKRFIDPAKTGRKIIVTRVQDEETKNVYESKRIFIPSLITDNPRLLENNPDYVASIYSIPDKAERDAKIKGDWYTFSGQVFSDLRIEHKLGEPEHACHVVDPFVIPTHWPRILAVDWGTAAATAAYWAAIAPQGDFYVYREYFNQGSKVSTWGTEIGDLSRGENLVANCLDSNAWNAISTEEKTVVEQYTEFSGLEPERASKDRISGKLLIQEYLRWKRIEDTIKETEAYNEDYAAFLLKSNKITQYKDYTRTNRIVYGGPLPRVKFFRGMCPHLLDTLPVCQYNDRGKFKEDVKPFNGDDPYDAFRYLCKLVHRYIDQSKKETQKIKETDKLITAAKTDPNVYHMLMANKPRGPQPVLRFRHKRGRIYVR